MTERQGESEIITSRTGAGLMKFLEVKSRKHELPDSVASPLRTASKRVLDVEDDPDGVDLTTVNIDGLIARFWNKNRATLTAQSLQAYEGRFRRALSMYYRWLNNDPDWVGKLRPSVAANGVTTTGKTAKTSVPGRHTAGRNARPSAEPPSLDSGPDEIVTERTTNADTPPDSELFDYPVALVDSKVTAILRLPRTYTTGDAARMAALINALAVPSSSSSSSDD